MGKVKDFAKCAVANRFSLAGYVLLISSFASPFVAKQFGIEYRDFVEEYVQYSFTSFIAGILLLAFTSGGQETCKAYQKAKKHIKGYGVLDSRYVDKYESYCYKSGIKLAAKEFGLLKKL